MLNLDHHITLNEKLIQSPNLCSEFGDADLDKIGVAVYEGYLQDKQSRTLWEKRTESAMDLAMQISKDKNFPWTNCSNVAFPLVTIAVMQFHARAYPALISGTDVVKCRVVGEDLDGKKGARADRISEHMSYQVLEQDSAWEEQHDNLLINVAVVGTSFIKSYYSGSKAHNVSELVSAKDLIVNYWAKSVEECDRKTHYIPLSRNEVHERVLRGTYRDVLEEPWYKEGVTNQQTTTQIKADTRAGTTVPQQDATTPIVALEQHCSLDLDGDGYAEPYIVTIEESSRRVLRIVARFDREADIERVQHGARKGEIISIKAVEYFTRYILIPSPDGGIYGVGFGILLGPLNESVNSLVNQLIDAGTMANGGGGFLGRGAKIRGGAYTFAPFEWKRVDSTGDDLHKSIVPLQVREPSGVLLQLLSLLIDYTNRISGSTDMMVGENPGQNTPAQTSQAMLEQGAKIYTAIFKRIWRSMKEEFKKLYLLNAVYMPMKQSFGENGGFGLREDYLGDPNVIVPVADPRITSEQQRLMQAQALKQAAMSTPGYNLQLVETRYLQALHIDGIQAVYPGPDKTPPLPNAKMQVEQMKLEGKKLALQAAQMEFVVKMEEEKKLNQAKIVELHAKAALALEQAGGIKTGHEIAAFEAAIGAMKAHDQNLTEHMKLIMEGIQNEQKTTNGAGVPRLAGPSGDAGAEPTA